MTARVFFKEPGLFRTEEEASGGIVSIVDMSHGQSVILNPAEKSALRLEEPPATGQVPKRAPATSMIEDMRRLAQKQGEPAGEKTIGGVRARGFRVKEQGQDMTVWVDPHKRLPLLIEFAGRTGGLDFRASYSDIQVDPKLDESLFRLDPPAGYTLRKVAAKLFMTFEEAVVRMLRLYAENNGGAFPSRVDDFTVYQKGLSQRRKAKTAPEPEALEHAAALATIAANAQKLKDHFGYKVEGVKLGDARTIIFWYQPEGETRYRVVYGDLRIGDVSADQIPAKSKP
jgi:outer membrane lipoprotein-sorting protein